MGRRAQIVRLRWSEADVELGAIEWGVEWKARKYDASRRVVPTVAPLLALLKRRHTEQGRPDDGLVCPPLAGLELDRAAERELDRRLRRAEMEASGA
jgi:integrase